MTTARNLTGFKIVAVVLAMLFVVPLVPAMYIGSVPSARAMGPVKVGGTTDNAATSISTERNVVRDKNNNIFVVYENNGEIYFSKSTDNGVSFSTPIDISNDSAMAYARTSITPVIAYNGSALFVAWSDQTGAFNTPQYISVRSTKDNGTTWSPALTAQATIVPHPGTPNDRRQHPDIAVNDTTLYVVDTNDVGGARGNMLYMHISLNSGATFGGEITLVNGAGGGNGNNPSFPNIEVSNELVYIAYTYGTNPGDIDFLYSNRGKAIVGAGDFTAPRNIYQANTDSLYVSMVVSGSKVYLAWEEYLQNHVQVYFRNSTDSGVTWTPAIGQVPTDVSNTAGNAHYPTLTLGTNTILCTWADTEVHANRDLVYSEWNGTVWTNPTYITSDNNGTMWPSSGWKVQNNRLDIVWTNGTNPYDVLYYGVYIGGAAPVMDWTGENGYVVDGVNPDSGTTGHTYTWRVKYTDADNEAPLASFPRVYIDKDLNGDFTGVGEQVTMTEVDATDHTYSDGKLYTYSTRLKFVGAYTYRFVAFDINGRPASGEPTKVQNGPQINSLNEPPQLLWVQDWGYINDGLNPETGFTDTNFTYAIVYLDPLNESSANGFPKVYLDMDNNGNFTDPVDKAVSMTPVALSDMKYDDGKVFYYNTTMPVGTYKYKFYTEDLAGLSAETAAKNGPTVIAKGKPPVLAPTGEPGFLADGVDPDFGADTTQFNFRVKYTDPDSDLPTTGYPTISIDLNRDGNYTANEKFVMAETDPSDTNTMNGKVYSYSKVLTTLGMYKYSFAAMDINGSPSNVLNYPGPNVNSTNKPPLLTWLGAGGFATDGLDPETGNANSTIFHYQVLYSDENGDPPAAGYPKVWVDRNGDDIETPDEWFNMTDTNPSSTDYVNGKKYDYNTTFPTAGIYHYRFRAMDTKNAVGTGTPITKKDGPVISVSPNLPPKLVLLGTTGYNGTGVSPAVGNLDTTFIYKVKYIDIENDTPGKDWPRVYIDTDGDGTSDNIGVMQPEDTTDMSVVNGKVYVFKTKLPIEGDKYAYKFKAEDANTNIASDTGSIYDQIFYGPKVIVNKAPMLQFLGAGNFMNKGVDPDKAAENSTFTYRVIYRDPEGDKPKDGKVYLRIDLDKNKAIDTTDPKIVMTEANAQDQNYADGKEYTATYKFVENGDYGYRFEAQDPFNNTAGGQASMEYIPGPVVTEPMPNRAPTLTFTGETNYQTLGVNPLSALKGSRFTFRVKYIDPDNDAAAAGNPILIVGGQNYPMTASDPSDNNYVDGKIYTVDVTLAKDQTYTYSFAVKNVINQTASLGPLEGPVVTKKVSTPKAQALPDMLWIILLIIVAIVVAIIGYLVGARKKREPEHQYRPAPRGRQPHHTRYDEQREAAPMVPLTSAEVQEAPQAIEPPAEEPGPKAAEGVEAKSSADLKASSEQPTASGEDAKKPPEDKPGPPVEAETKPDLKAQQGDSEAPADDKDIKKDGEAPKPEEKPEDVDGEIDSILAKLEK